MKYLVRRLIHGLALLLGVSFLSFLLTQFVPGDFYQAMRLDPQISSQAIQSLRAQYGLDRPFPVRYFRWLKSAAAGDFGFSFAYDSPVMTILRPRVLNTLILTVPAAGIAWLLALPIGVWCAAWGGTLRDRICAAGTSALLAVPDLAVALALLLFAVRTGLFPTGGMHSAAAESMSRWGKARDLAEHLFLPCAALVLVLLPVLVRHVRASVVEAMDAAFVRTARGHGIPRLRILWRHVLPVGANPLISLFGMTAGGLLSTSLLIEVILSWPGLGPLVLEAILARDVHLVVGAVMCSTALLLASNLFADLLLYAADPRIRRV